MRTILSSMRYASIPADSRQPLARRASGRSRYFLNETVTLRKYRDLPEALLAKGCLESAGIEAYLMDDNMVRMDWFYSNLIGGIKLKVQPGDVDAANEILSQPIPEAIEVEGIDYEQPKCPQCQSLDISYRQLNKLVSY